MKINIVLAVSVILIVFSSAKSSYGGFNFTPNELMTTPFGPAYADIVLESVNFLPCEGGPYALCYYSGPGPETCELVGDGTFANCKCFEIPYGKYYVLINAILNEDIYLETVAECGEDGSGCQTTNSAPVCESINNGAFIPGTDMISTFSFACVPELGIGQTNCPQSLYAGCMTAPCTNTADEGIVDCLCPTYDGPYQVGQNNEVCTLEDDLVWSAAYNPNISGTFPAPPVDGCIPDAPVELGGCPLITSDIPSPPDNVDCAAVCEEYSSCRGADGIELGYTCDATLCTSGCEDSSLVGEACSGLQDCKITEIIRLESEVGCSCCASQICGCEASTGTEEAVFGLNQRQRELGLTPQCDVNGTLCGEPRQLEGSGSGCSISSSGASAELPLYLLLPGLVAAGMLRRRFLY